MINHQFVFHSVLTYSNNDPLGYEIVGFFIGIFLFYKGFKELILKRIIQNTPTSKIRAIAMGLVEVKGKAVCRKELTSPLSNKKCVYFDWKIERYVSSKNGGHWSTVALGSSSDPFYIKDDTAQAIVFPNGAKLKLRTDMQIKCYSNELKPSWKQFFDSQKISHRSGFFGGSKFRITEIYIEPEDNLYILGTAHFWKAKKITTPFMKDEEKKILEKISENDSKCNASIMKGKNSKYFFISDKSEKELIKSMSWQIPLMLFGGPLLSAACLIGILIEFHVFK
jgi:hypothetical protein